MASAIPGAIQFAEYRIPGLAGLSVNGSWFYTGERAVNNANQTTIPGYGTFSFGARYLTRIVGKKTSWQLSVGNVTDKDYWSTAGNGLLGVGAPRTVRLAMCVELRTFLYRDLPAQRKLRREPATPAVLKQRGRPSPAANQCSRQQPGFSKVTARFPAGCKY
jgi:hypothetical protein